jgi:hypothetical protein
MFSLETKSLRRYSLPMAGMKCEVIHSIEGATGRKSPITACGILAESSLPQPQLPQPDPISVSMNNKKPRVHKYNECGGWVPTPSLPFHQ